MLNYTKGIATDFNDLISKIVVWVTDETIHGEDVWKVMRNEPWPRGTILKAHGFKDGEISYIGLMPNTIVKGDTYKNWLMKKENLATYFVWSDKGLKQNGQDFFVSGNEIRTENAMHTFTETPDIFERSSQVLHLGAFKQYSELLDWHEQAGGMDFTDLPLMNLQYTTKIGNANPYMQDFNPPVYPGVGYPSLSLDSNGPTIGTFKYWLLKDRHCLIIVMNNAEKWDSAFIGLMNPYDHEEYAFPAAVIGGTSGLVPFGKDVKYTSNQITPSAVIGLKVDYHPDNWHLGHGIPVFATAGIDHPLCPTQAMLMLPDGRWQGFANYVQSLNAVNEHSCNGSRVTKHYFLRTEPIIPSKINFYIRPTDADLTDFSHVYDKKQDNYIYKLEPVEFVQADEERKGILGKIPYMYYPSHAPVRYGEITINDKKYLMLPNVWEKRKFHLLGQAGVIYDVDLNVLLARDLKNEKIARMMNLVIRLEE